MTTFIKRLAVPAVALLFTGAADLMALEPFELPAINAAALKAAAAQDRRAAAEPAKPGAPAVKEWTVMVYMNAKNNLSESDGPVGDISAKDIDEMKKVGTTPSVNVVVELGANGKGSRRMLILKKEGGPSSGETLLGEDPAADMGDYRRVIDFIRSAKAAYPAKRYMLVLWNHGLGWIDPGQKQKSAPGSASKGILFDDDTKNYVRTRQLGEILRQTGYVDVLAMNACLMQMAEVGYEVKDNTGLILASEETMLATGFEYEKLLTFMNADPGFTSEQLSGFMMKWFRDFYSADITMGPMTVPQGTMPATLSTIRPGALNELPPYLDAFAAAVMNNNETEAAKKAIGSAVRFASLLQGFDAKKMLAPYVDLYDFAAVTGANARSQETRQAAESLMGFIKSKLVMDSVGLYADRENGYDYTKAGGIAVAMTMKINPVPPGLVNFSETPYPTLALSQNSLWDEFVGWCDAAWRQ